MPSTNGMPTTDGDSTADSSGVAGRVTRRQLLAGGAVATAAGGGYLVIEGTAGPSPTFSAWEADAGEWPATRRGTRRTSAAPGMDPPRGTPETAWTFSGIDAETVVVADGAAFVGGQSAVAALSLPDGTLQWTAETEGESLCYRDGVLYCAGGNTVAAVDRDGERVWEVAEASRRFDLLVSDGQVLVGSADGVTARDAADGDDEWRLSMGSARSYLAVSEGTLYVTRTSGAFAYGPRDGWSAVRDDAPTEVARAEVGDRGVHPAVTDGSVVVGGLSIGSISDDDPGERLSVRAFDPATLSDRWAADELLAQRLWSPAVADGTGLVLGRDRTRSEQHLLAGLAPETGSIRWRTFDDGTAFIAGPVLAGDLGLVGRRDGTVLAVDPETGRQQWQYSLDAEVGVIVPAGDRLLVTAGGSVYSLA